MPRLVTIVPAFNEEASIPHVIAEIQRTLPDSAVVVIDDGSEDRTGEVAAKAGATLLTLPLNLGIGAAVQAGYKWAVRERYDIVLRVDGDGQHDLRWAERLITEVESGQVDVAIGSRFLEDGPNHRPPLLRRIGINLFSLAVSSMIGQRIKDPTSGYRCVNHRVADYSARHHPYDFPEVESVVHYAKAGFRVAEVPVRMRDRSHGSSTIRGVRSIYYAAKVLLALLILVIGKKRPEVQQ